MRWLFLVLVAVLLNGYEVTIQSVDGNIVTLDKYVKKGVSGVVLCPYGDKEIICAKALSLGKKAKLLTYDNLKDDAFALPVVYPKKSDKILFAKDYDRIMIIAPDQYMYLKVKEKYKNAVIINPDNFAEFLSEIPTKENFINFAKKMNIGMFVFVLDKIYEVDADSFYAVKVYGKNDKKYNEMFFTTYPKFKVEKNMIAYYKSLIKE
jgi:hypothetical protein